MSTDRHVTLFHSTSSRSSGVLVLLEELGADYELHVLDQKKGEQRRAEYAKHVGVENVSRDETVEAREENGRH